MINETVRKVPLKPIDLDFSMNLEQQEKRQKIPSFLKGPDIANPIKYHRRTIASPPFTPVNGHDFIDVDEI